jgi:hypothetical protein
MRTRPHGNGPVARRAGFSLIEILTVMWALSVALVLGAVLLVAAMKTDQVAATTLRGLAWRAELADQFRADVAGADAAPDRLGEFARGPSCLILRRPDGSHVIYRWLDGQLERIVRTADGETRRPLPVGPQDPAVEFDRTGGRPPLVTLRFAESAARRGAPRVEVTAVLGGDLR